MKRDLKNVFILLLVVAIAVMAAGYAAFAQTLEINGTATIDGRWDVEIVGITSEVEGEAKAGTPTFTASTANFAALLNQPGDSVTYTITVKNKGTIDAKLNSITLNPQVIEDDESPAIVYEVISQPALGSELAADASTTVVVKVSYSSTVTETPTTTVRSFTGVLEYVQSN